MQQTLEPVPESYLSLSLPAPATMSIKIGTRIQKDFDGKYNCGVHETIFTVAVLQLLTPPHNIGKPFGGTITSKEVEEGGTKVRRLSMQHVYCCSTCCLTCHCHENTVVLEHQKSTRFSVCYRFFSLNFPSPCCHLTGLLKHRRNAICIRC